ncbi:MAG: class I SAM-dependent methyltransferase [archaeon]
MTDDNGKNPHDFHKTSRACNLLVEQPGYEATVQGYFADSGPIYDKAGGNPFWRLSRALIFDFLGTHAVDRLIGQGANYLDAGGGTGLLAFHVLKKDHSAKVTIYDLSPGMLEQAEIKRAELGLEGRLTLIEGNLTNMHDIADGTYDVVMSANNVLGFIYDSKAAMREMARVAKSGAPIVMTAVPNAFHGMYFNVSNNRYEVAVRIRDEGIGTFTDVMPDIHFFTPSGLVELYLTAGITPIICTGSPITTYPGAIDTDARLVSDRAQGLADSDIWQRVYRLEAHYASMGVIPGSYVTEHASRGNALLIAGQKP